MKLNAEKRKRLRRKLQRDTESVLKRGQDIEKIKVKFKNLLEVKERMEGLVEKYRLYEVPIGFCQQKVAFSSSKLFVNRIICKKSWMHRHISKTSMTY